MAIRSKTKEKQQQTGLAVTDRASAEAALSAGGYEKSDPVLAAEQRLAEYEQTKPGAYSSAYQDKIDGLLDRILNREGFSYDFNADPLYQTYKDQYLHNGRLALQDTMAGAAAATGGYASSYAAAAGSGAYQSYLNQLNGRLPELYRAALERYQANGSTLQERLTGLTAQDKARRLPIRTGSRTTTRACRPIPTRQKTLTTRTMRNMKAGARRWRTSGTIMQGRSSRA